MNSTRFSTYFRCGLRWGMVAVLSSTLAGCNKAPEESPEASQQDAGPISYDPIGELRAFIEMEKLDLSTGTRRTALPRPPRVAFDPDKTYFWNLDTTEGPIKVKFLAQDAPMHVSSTVYLTELGFYDLLSFHRVIPGFMAQGGCPMGTGTGSPGYKYDGEFDGPTTHSRKGMLSMANSGPGTDGSQFFLTFVAKASLDGKHTVFGEVVGDDSFATLKALERNGTPSGTPLTRMKINKATISVE